MCLKVMKYEKKNDHPYKIYRRAKSFLNLDLDEAIAYTHTKKTMMIESHQTVIYKLFLFPFFIDFQ